MFPKAKPYNPFVQIAAMRSRFPQFRVKKKGYLDFEFVGNLQVKPEFPVYTVSVHYQGDLYPVVKILRPVLVDNPPHVYSKEGKLCLYKPANYNWNRRKLVATDIIPWAAGWIYFYEMWLKKKIWYGPEASHDSGDTK